MGAKRLGLKIEAEKAPIAKIAPLAIQPIPLRKNATGSKNPRLLAGAIRPRPAVISMARYSPPTEDRLGKLRLDFNENTIGCSPKVMEAIAAGVSRESLSVYPEYVAARQALSDHFRLPEDQILLTNGTDEAIQVLVHTFVDDGQQVVMPRPSYAMYRFYCQVAGAQIVDVDYAGPDYEFPLQAMLDAITPETRLVLLANPNSPTGTALSLANMERILKRARRAAVLIDEAYYEFCGITAAGLIDQYPNLFVSRTFSKVYGMAGLRLGVVLSNAPSVAFLHKAQSPYSVNVVAALAAGAAVTDTAYVQAYVAEILAAREVLDVGLERLGIPYVRSSANFVMANFGKRSLDICDRLGGSAILVRDRSHEITGAVRITVGTSAQIHQLLLELQKLVGLKRS